MRLGKRILVLVAALLALSVDQRVAWPAGTNTVEPPHWSLQPVVRPEVPKTKNSAWSRTSVDQFILSKLEEKGLAPSLEADARTLLRRVYFDAIGLPPTPEEMDAFLSDNLPLAYERVVDRLLASPRYGERWARHWLDIVHYAETHGNDQDRPRPNAWPYRDYVIRSFNRDKPYAQFVEEQLAGDVLFPDDPDGVIATGFMATGPWDESSLRDIQENTIDRQIARYLDRDDIVMTTMSTFASTTVHCARCHDHKFDPILQAEYYGLQSVFSAIDKADRVYDVDRPTHTRRQALLKQKAALEVRSKAMMDSLLQPPVQTEVAAWEKSLAEQGGAAAWTVLDPASFVSEGGAILTKQPDRSVLASGPRPEIDTYTIAAQTDLTGLTAMRLEVLSDEALPKKGPGRQDNGNLHLTELAVRAWPKGETNKVVRIALQHPSADFNQADWDIAKAIDGDPKSAWGIYPEVGKTHTAVVEFKEDVGSAGGTTLLFVLEQEHGGGHLIGRPRLSVTTAPRPVQVGGQPEAVAVILAVPASQRTREQHLDLAAHYVRTRIEQELARLPKPQMVYGGASDFAPDGSFKPAKVPRPVQILKRGDINKPGETAVPGALAGKLTVMAGGTAENFERARPVMRDLCANYTLMGGNGAGQTTKLINQLFCAIAFQAVAEAVKLAEAGGVDPRKIPAALAGGRADNRMMQEFMVKFADRDFTPTGRLDNMLKDLDSVQAFALATKTPLPLTSAVTEIHRLLIAMGLGSKDSAEAMRLLDGK